MIKLSKQLTRVRGMDSGRRWPVVDGAEAGGCWMWYKMEGYVG
jgi:hypothetical protein